MRERSLLAELIFVAIASTASAQTTLRDQTAQTSEGFVIESSVVKARCGGCHRSDDKGRMSRISYRRATPENWERTIKRMVSLNHAQLTPEDARTILKYLADRQGLAPEELRPI